MHIKLCEGLAQTGKKKLLFHLNLQVRMKEVMSAVWLQGLDLSYLREQVNSLNTSYQLLLAGTERPCLAVNFTLKTVVSM